MRYVRSSKKKKKNPLSVIEKYPATPEGMCENMLSIRRILNDAKSESAVRHIDYYYTVADRDCSEDKKDDITHCSTWKKMAERRFRETLIFPPTISRNKNVLSIYEIEVLSNFFSFFFKLFNSSFFISSNKSGYLWIITIRLYIFFC